MKVIGFHQADAGAVILAAHDRGVGAGREGCFDRRLAVVGPVGLWARAKGLFELENSAAYNLTVDQDIDAIGARPESA